MPRICLTTREHRPHGGGIGVSVPALARVLAEEHEVVLITDGHQDGLPETADGVRRVGVGDWADWERAGFACEAHAWSAAVLRGLEEAYGDGPGPDLLESPDYSGEAYVSLQAARTGHELLHGCRFVVRMRGTAELVALHNDRWPSDDRSLALFAMERDALARADQVVFAGGRCDRIYEQYYGENAVAPRRRVRLPLPELTLPPPRRPRAPGDPLRLVYVGRLERRKGVLDLVEAVCSIPDVALTLTMIGEDTRTGPLDRSMRAVLEVMIGEDARIHIRSHADRGEVTAAMSEADAVVVPSRFEWWANVAQEAMAVGTPIIATPVGGLVEQVVPGVTGWLARSVGASAIAEVIERLGTDRDLVERVRTAGGPRVHVDRLTDRRDILRSYDGLLALPRRYERVTSASATVTAVIPTHNDAASIHRASLSFLAESGELGDVVVVDDGSGSPALPALDVLRGHARVRVVHRLNGGASAARNTGVAFADGEYLLFLDADDELVPGFLGRAIQALAADELLAFAIPWHDLGGEEAGRPNGWCPLGTGHPLMTDLNVVGGSCVVFRRRMFDDPALRFEPENVINQDREILVQLLDRGSEGVVVPMLGVRSRRRPEGISVRYMAANKTIALSEIEARRRRRRVEWTATSG